MFVGGSAVVGDGCKIANNVSLYDSVTLDEAVFVGPSVVFTNVRTPRAFISRKHDFRPTRVGRGATIGANATVICGRTLGEYCFVAAGAVVTRDVQAHALVMGSPARRRGWVCTCGETLAVPAAVALGPIRCAACDSIFRLTTFTAGGSVEGISPQR